MGAAQEANQVGLTDAAGGGELAGGEVTGEPEVETIGCWKCRILGSGGDGAKTVGF